MTPDQIERYAELAYQAFCDAQGAHPRPWTGRDALPDSRKQVWRRTVTTLARAITRQPAAPPAPVPVLPERADPLGIIRAVAREAPADVLAILDGMASAQVRRELRPVGD